MKSTACKGFVEVLWQGVQGVDPMTPAKIWNQIKICCQYNVMKICNKTLANITINKDSSSQKYSRSSLQEYVR